MDLIEQQKNYNSNLNNKMENNNKIDKNELFTLCSKCGLDLTPNQFNDTGIVYCHKCFISVPIGAVSYLNKMKGGIEMVEKKKQQIAKKAEVKVKKEKKESAIEKRLDLADKVVKYMQIDLQITKEELLKINHQVWKKLKLV